MTQGLMAPDHAPCTNVTPAAAAAAAGVAIRRAGSSGDCRAFAQLAADYSTSLGVSLAFQNFEQELATLPGCYAEPRGCIFLASDGRGRDVGCVALRPLAKDAAAGSSREAAGQEAVCEAVCEMKRLWVDPCARGGGIGKALVQAVIQAAEDAGYTRMVLDTLERLKGANAIYEAAGFMRTRAYYANPLPHVVYWELVLPRVHSSNPYLDLLSDHMRR